MRMHPQKRARSFFTPQVYPHILGKIFRPFSYTHDPQGPPDLFRGSLGWLSESLFCLCETDSYAKRGFVRHLTSIAAAIFLYIGAHSSWSSLYQKHYFSLS